MINECHFQCKKKIEAKINNDKNTETCNWVNECAPTSLKINGLNAIKLFPCLFIPFFFLPHFFCRIHLSFLFHTFLTVVTVFLIIVRHTRSAVILLPFIKCTEKVNTRIIISVNVHQNRLSNGIFVFVSLFTSPWEITPIAFCFSIFKWQTSHFAVCQLNDFFNSVRFVAIFLFGFYWMTIFSLNRVIILSIDQTIYSKIFCFCSSSSLGTSHSIQNEINKTVW